MLSLSLVSTRSVALFLFAFVLIASALRAQDGANDPTFNVVDDGTHGDGASSNVHATVRQPDGKVLIGGAFTTYNGVPRRYVARLNVDGSLDTSFDPGAGAQAYVTSLALQPDGKVLVAGTFTSFDGVLRKRVARLNADGSLDASFEPQRAANGDVNTIVLQPDGKIVIGGSFTTYDLAARRRIARVNPDGSVDTSFDPGVGPNYLVHAIAVQPDGKLVVGGTFTTFSGASRVRLARLHPNGALDTSFDARAGASYTVRALAVQPDGKLLLGGGFTLVDNVLRNRVARLNADGSLDTGFDPGTGADGDVRSLLLQSNGRVLIGGWFSKYDDITRNGLARLESDGNLDSSFAPATPTGRRVDSLAMQPDGKVLLGGSFYGTWPLYLNPVSRTNPDGSEDTTFNPGKGANSNVSAVVVQPDGKTLVAGSFTKFNATPRGRIARLNLDGSLDAGFAVGAGADGGAGALALQPDGRVVIAGYFTTYDGVPRRCLARLNADGSLDTSFDPGSGADSSVRAVALQPDGRLLIAGLFTEYDGVVRRHVARVNPDGSLDASFDPGVGPSHQVLAMALQPDGKPLIAGVFNTFAGVPRGRVARLEADGSLDVGFAAGAGSNGTLHALALQPDGKLFLSGQFSGYDGVPRKHLVRVNTDGSLDPTFAQGVGPDNAIYELALQPDLKLLIAGFFTTYDGVPRKSLARLNSDGSVDASFDPGGGDNQGISAIGVQPDGKLVIGGSFGEYGGAVRHRIARVISSWPAGVAYCTSGTSTNGCAATMGFTGSPSVAAPSGFTLDVLNVEGAKLGLVFYGLSGRKADPWAGGSTSFLCVKAPLQRMGAMNSGGAAGQCNGALSIDWLAYLAANPSALGAPFAAGATVNAQAWFRDPPAPKTTNLSNALEFFTAP